MLLPNGCSCSEPSVHPVNWKDGGKSLLKESWYIQYWFKDPAYADKHKYGKLFTIRMNKHKLLDDRRNATAAALDHLKKMLRDHGYNPHIKKCTVIQPTGINFDISSETPFSLAMQKAYESIQVCAHTKTDLKSVLKYSQVSIAALSYDHLPVTTVRRKHIKMILEHLSKTKEIWTDNTFNYYRAHLSMLFHELEQYEAIDFNPVEKVEKKEVIKDQLTAPSKAERRDIDRELRKKGKLDKKIRRQMLRYRIYLRIFFHSGIRNTEMVSLRGKDVNLETQRIRVLIRKGKKKKIVYKTIKDIALRYWKLALASCGPDDYIFSEGLEPGKERISAAQLSRRWNRHCKEPHKKEEDRLINTKHRAYALKHSNTTETVDIADEQTAADQNSHSGTGMVVTIYDTKQAKRQHERNRKINNDY